MDLKIDTLPLILPNPVHIFVCLFTTKHIRLTYVGGKAVLHLVVFLKMDFVSVPLTR